MKKKKKLGTYFEYKKSIKTQETFVKEIGINKALKRWHFAIKIKKKSKKHDVALLLQKLCRLP